VRYAGLKGIQPAGVACDERGRLFVAAFSIRAGSSFAAPGIVLVENEHAQPRALAQPLGAAAFATPNGVAFAPGAGIYATDTLGGVVIREAENAQGQFEATVVARNLLGVNGIAYDPLSRKLYVSNSLTQEVSSFAVAADGTLGTIKKEWTGQGTQLDGLAVDEKGSVYVANYGQGPVLRVPDEMMVAMVKNPSSLAFRGGSLLVVDYHLNQPTVEGGLYSAELGRCGAELFGRR
jgi:sugar lactone lactonase YvrE